MQLYVQYLLGGLTLGAIYALIGLGMVVVYKVSSIVNFSHGHLAVVGALGAITVAETFDLPAPFAIPLGMLVGAILGVITYLVLVAPIWRRSIEGAVVMTIAGFMIYQGLALVGWGSDPRALAPAVSGPAVSVFGGTMSRQSLLILAVAIVVAAGLAWFLNRTVAGKAFLACDEDAYGAELCGISVARWGLIALVIAGCLAGLAGVLIAPLTGMSYVQGGSLLLRGLTAAVIGGVSSSSGAFVGALFLGVLDSVVGGEAPQFREAIVFLTLIVCLAIRPTGLLAARS
jgi:branched-chain amino acid transport system permease protein